MQHVSIEYYIITGSGKRHALDLLQSEQDEAVLVPAEAIAG